MNQKQFNTLAIVILIVVGIMLLTGCNEVPRQTHREYEDHMNNTVNLYCDLYRTSDASSRVTIEHELERIMAGYTGRIDRDAEYCLNSMGIDR